MRIYVGGLSYSTSDEELRSTFSRYGEVESATVVIDRFTQRSRGFGFVEMPNSQEANEAINALNGRELGGRRITVNEARPRQERAGTSGRDRGGSERRYDR